MNSVEGIRASIPTYLRWIDKCKIPCIKCKEERWVIKKHIFRDGFTGWCGKCRHEQRGTLGYYAKTNIRHRLKKNPSGYIMISLPIGDPLIGMANQSRIILEHRLVVAEALGRLLNRREIVHHINRIKDDNRIENLTIVSSKRHEQIMALERRIDYLERLLRKNAILFNGKIKVT